jgi:TRAP-type uncharacterized transport system substrate-binding protein
MELLPRGANFRRSKILWELALHIAADPKIPYGGNRDMCIAVGSGSGERFEPSLRLATGSAVLAHEVASGGLEMAFVNPSAMLTQAYRGVGLFRERLPVRIIGSYPSEDRFVVAVRESLGLRTLGDIKAAKPALRISVREDPTHSTLVLVAQLLGFYGLSLEDFEAWGGSIQRIGGPGSKQRLDGLRDGTIDMVLDEGIRTWLGTALDTGLVPLDVEPDAFAHLDALGWRRMALSPKRFPQLTREYECIDFSGWPLYAAAALPDEVAYAICGAFVARAHEMTWEDGTFTGIGQVFHETDATPMDVPMHPGAARWYEEHAAEL